MNTYIIPKLSRGRYLTKIYIGRGGDGIESI